jgi:hypothetical protein
MTPATARFYEAVVNGQLTHSGDRGRPRRPPRQGTERLTRRIDAAVAAVMAHDRAAALAGTSRVGIYL